MTLDETNNTCMPDSVEFKANGEEHNMGPMPWLSSGLNTQPRSVSAEGHGFYNGRTNAAGWEHEYLPYENFQLSISFRADAPDGVIYSIRDVEFIDDPSKIRVSNLDPAKVSYTGVIELRITPCSNLLFTFGKHTVLYDTRVNLGEWYAHQFNLSDGITRLYTNHIANNPDSSLDEEKPEEQVITPLTDRVYNNKRVEIWIGAARGKFDWFHGFLGTLKFSTNPTLAAWGRDDAFGLLLDDALDDEADVAPLYGYCPLGYTYLSIPNTENFLQGRDWDNVCYPCDDSCFETCQPVAASLFPATSCTSGAYLSGNCNPICRACDTSDPNHCTQCWPFAHHYQNTCRCNNGYIGAADSCKLECTDEHCSDCYLDATIGQVCLKCEDGYQHNADNTCTKCINHFDSLSETCLSDKDMLYYNDYC